jgi:hypothetical protein
VTEREWLSSLSGSSKIARAAREALAVTGNGAARSRAAANQAARARTHTLRA